MRRWMCLGGLMLIMLPAYAELTFLNEADKYSTIVIQADQLSVSYTEFSPRSVRATKAVQPGSGFFYFEGQRLVSPADIGFGVCTAATPLDNRMGRDATSLSIVTTGIMWSSNTWQGNIPNSADTYGIAVDYRGTHPLIHVIGATTADGPGVYLGSFTLSAVTDAVYIAVWGLGPGGQVRQRINAGDDLGAHPFRFDPVQALTEAYYYPIEGIDELVPGWGVPDPGLNQAPTLTPGGPQTVVLGNEATLSAAAADAEDGDLTATVAYTADEGPTGSGPLFAYTPGTVGAHTVTVTVTDSGGLSATAEIAVTVIANGSVDNDGDGLSYDAEITLGTNPSLADTDGDGLDDGTEAVYFADPLLPDTDGDGRDDAYEALHGTLPETADGAADPDGDGFDNDAEYAAGSHPLKADSRPTDGVVLLNPADAAPGAALSGDGLSVTFAAALGGGAMQAVRGDTAVAPGSGWYYFEGRRAGAPAAFGFGIASAAETLDHFGGQTDQSVGLFSTGNLYHNNAVADSFAETAATEVYGLAVDYTGAHPVVYAVVADALAQPLVLGPVTLSAVSGDVYPFVFGEPGTGGTLNAGAHPDTAPFTYPADYAIFDTGVAGAEFMGTGWGPDHAYSGRPTPRQFDRVFLDPDFTPAGDDINFGPDKLSCSYTQGIKMAVRANTGMIGQFRYWEANRDINAGNYGQGYITAHAYLNPYCCVTASLDGAPPSMSVNSSAKIWRNLVSQADYDISNTHYGFAVDYRGARPIVYVIIGDTLAITLTLDDMFSPIFPMLYGNTQGFVRTNTANFGASPFVYDVRTILQGEGIDTTELIEGWGDPNDGETPVVTGQNLVTMDEDTSRLIDVTDVLFQDPSGGAVRGGTTLTVTNGTNYTHVGNTVTPVAEFSGNLVVPVTLSDGVFTSRSFDLVVRVAPVDDPPTITAQSGPLATDEETPLTLTLADVAVADVDSSFPAAFTLSVGSGANYSVDGTTLTPDTDFNGTLTVPVTVHDGTSASPSFNLSVTVDPVNDPPTIQGAAAPVSTPEDTARTLTLADLTVTDPDNSYPTGFSLSVADGDDYSRSGNTITPALDFNGTLTVPVTVHDGTDAGAPYDLQVTVDPVNDPPSISAQTALVTPPQTALTVTLADLTVTDPDNDAADWTLTLSDGADYSRAGNTVTPDPGFTGILTVPAVVHDGAAGSDPFNLSIIVCVPPSIDTQPTATAVCEGDMLQLNLAASGPGTLTYQWYRNNAPIAGATAAQLTLNDITSAEAGSYTCTVFNGCVAATSTAATVTVNRPVSFTAQPESGAVCPGDTAVFQVTAQGTGPLSYQWTRDGADIPLATAATYIINDLEPADAGLYACRVTNTCGSQTTAEAVLTVDGPLTADIDASAAAAGLSPLTLAADIGCALPEVAYEWHDVTRATVLGQNISPLVVDPLPAETTIYELAVLDGQSLESVTTRITFLVPDNNAYLDLNGDGCNSIDDLFLLLEAWREQDAEDADGTGRIDVRDYLYINTSGTGPQCP